MKHKVGDIVRIKSREWYNINQGEYSKVRCGNIFFFEEMSVYCGKSAKIENIIDSEYYCLDVDNHEWFWSDEMFEESEPKVISEEIIRAAALKYAGFKEGVDPNDEDERYFNGTKCELYDAFIAGAKFIQNQK